MSKLIEIQEIGQDKIPVIQKLTMNVWPQTYSSIISKDQIDFMLEMMYSTDALQNQMKAGHQYVHLTVDKEPRGFA